MSPTKSAMNRRYVRAKARFGNTVTCAMSGAQIDRNYAEPHHIYGRIGTRLLAFVWLSGPCHEIIHLHGEEAAHLGWIQAEFRGMKATSPRAFPWARSAESEWPLEWRREAVMERDKTP